MDEAFSSKEQRAIPASKIINPDNADYGTKGGVDTEDQIFLLSIDEANRYFSGDKDRIALITMADEDLAYILRIAEEDRGYGQESLDDLESRYRSEYLNQRRAWRWWLRSPGSDGDPAAGVYGDGGVYGYDDNVFYDGGVRPAFWLNLGS
jgi:hypothetical protein